MKRNKKIRIVLALLIAALLPCGVLIAGIYYKLTDKKLEDHGKEIFE